jgi:transposase
MARYKPVQRNGMFIPVVFEEQVQPGTFEFALAHLVDEELDLSARDAKFRNDATGASAYDPRALLKIVLLAYSRGLITSRTIEAACEHNVLFMALSGDARPSYSHIAKFVRELGPEVSRLFSQVLMTCDRLGLIGISMRSARHASTSCARKRKPPATSSPPTPGARTAKARNSRPT